MNFYFVTRMESEPPVGDDLLFVRIAGRLIPLTPSALDRLAIDPDATPANALPPASPDPHPSPSRA